MTDKVQQRLYHALWIISRFDSTKYLRSNSESAYGVDYPEALEMSYENIIDLAKQAIRGVRPPLPNSPHHARKNPPDTPA